MKVEEAISRLKKLLTGALLNITVEYEKKYEEAIQQGISALKKTSDKNCSKCVYKGKCAIYDNFNIDYCSDWSDE